jgi:D-alanyl-lipoteichoic acid acyltransferase DltB (MBOAT superfamily)
VLLADPLGTIANNGWSRIGELSAPGAWMVILAYTLQLYLDFSGYCDIASGCARMLGLRLPVNFDSPYRAVSVTRFWKGWHMTLTAFLRECLYFPLGGSKRGAVRAYINILIVFLVSGFWHGAGWTFILWGLLHGLAQVAERLLGDRLERIPALIRWAVTFAFVNIAWVFFRAPDVASALDLLKAAVAGGFAMPPSWLVQGVLAKEVAAVQLLVPAAKAWMPRILSVVLFGGGLTAALVPGNTIRKMDTFRPTVWRAVVLCLLLSWSILSFSGVATFIYSNF